MNVVLIENVNKMRIYISHAFNLITLIFVYLTLLLTPIETFSENYVFQKESLLNDEENSNISSCNLSLISIDNILPCFGVIRPVIKLNIVDLPTPLGPSIPNIVPL